MIKHELIRKLRLARKLRLEDLAAEVGISPSLLSRYETGQMVLPVLETLRALEAALGLKKNDLLE